MTTAVVLFTRDLRVHDNPALSTAVDGHDRVVPLFVLDDRLLARQARAANRHAFLLESLDDLRTSLRRLSGELVVRRGDTVREVIGVARVSRATAVVLAEDASAYAAERSDRLAAACAAEGLELHITPGPTVVPAGDLTPSDRDHFRVFTPYLRRWQATATRSVLAPPARVHIPDGLTAGDLPGLGALTTVSPSPGRARGGETAGRTRLERWLAVGVRSYAHARDDLAADGTSRLSPYLHFGCISAVDVTTRARSRPDAEAFVRQLCWRDFFHQLLAARPDTAARDLHPGRRTWLERPDALAAWRDGRTGYPIVDAGMRQLREEGFMHNRARLVVASFLTKTLGVDWRHGARHFAELLTDADVASNTGSWQWVAGTGTDTRPGRVLNPTRQALRFDPTGDYVRRHVLELAAIGGRSVHEPWKLGLLRPSTYPERIVVHEEQTGPLLAPRS